VESNANPQQLLLTIHQPKAAGLYYTTCGKIDQCNRCCQDTLNLEKKLETNEWHRQLNMLIFGIVVVDSWMLYKGCTGGGKMTQTEFYKALIDGLINNTYYDDAQAGNQVSTHSVLIGSCARAATSGTGLHLTPTKRKRGSVESSESKRKQNQCKGCGMKTIMLCSICCQDTDSGESQAAHCHPITNRACMEVESIGLIAMGVNPGSVNIVRAVYSKEYKASQNPWSPPHLFWCLY
jgi:hypothetical protein